MKSIPGLGLIQNVLTSRAQWLRNLLDTSKRDIDVECGHPDTIGLEDYAEAFERGDVSKRIVSIYPEDSWADDPVVFETEDETETAFEKEWLELQESLHLFSFLQRADMLSGIGHFGIILLGIDDGLLLIEPVATMNERGEAVSGAKRKLLYVRPFDETLVKVTELQSDATNPRFGLPTQYEIDFAETGADKGTVTSGPTKQKVHWSRVIHLADNRTNSEIVGTPRMKWVYNRWLDLKKIAGGSGEMFWKGGFPGYSLETVPVEAGETIVIDKEATKEQMTAYMEGLQRYIATVGMTVKSLSLQIADPGPHAELQLKMIAMAMGCPWRIFIGSEAAQLASEQDTRTWNKRLNRRRVSYLTPFVILPFVKRLIALGVLTEPKSIIVKWSDLNAPSDKEKAEVAAKRTEALSKYAASGLQTLMVPFHYLTLILGMTDDEANAIIEEGEGQILDVDGEEEEEATPQE